MHMPHIQLYSLGTDSLAAHLITHDAESYGYTIICDKKFSSCWENRLESPRRKRSRKATRSQIWQQRWSSKCTWGEQAACMPTSDRQK